MYYPYNWNVLECELGRECEQGHNSLIGWLCLFNPSQPCIANSTKEPRVFKINGSCFVFPQPNSENLEQLAYLFGKSLCAYLPQTGVTDRSMVRLPTPHPREGAAFRVLSEIAFHVTLKISFRSLFVECVQPWFHLCTFWLPWHKFRLISEYFQDIIILIMKYTYTFIHNVYSFLICDFIIYQILSF